MAVNTGQYKRQNRPNMSDKAKFHQGYFIPSNPDKWVTKEIIYRSSWELGFCQWADRNPNVIRVASEPCAVKYLNPVSNLAYCKDNNLDPKNPHNWKMANYYTDFWMEVKGKDGGIKKIFIEIKPYEQTQKPQPINEGAKLKEMRAYNRTAETYLVNMAKWDAAKKYFNARGCDFAVFTERTLSKLGILID